MKKNNISMVEIAKMAGVSIATVSRVLNHNGRFSAETEKRVMDVVNKFDYTINPNAQGLRTNHSKTIGVIIPDITNEYFAQVVRSIEIALLNSEYSIFVCDTNENVQAEDYHLKSLKSKGVDGIIYISTRKSIDEIKDDFDVPVVYIDRSPGIQYNLITSDNKMGGYMATQELIKSGCKKIIMLRDKNVLNTVKDREKGFFKALKEYHLDCVEESVIPCTVSYDVACEKIIELLDNGVDFDGVFCCTDVMALGALHGLKQCGKKVPEDVKLVGFDGIRSTKISEPPITTVIQNTEAIGSKSVESLLKMIDNKAIKVPECIIPIELSIRDSTKNKK